MQGIIVENISNLYKIEYKGTIYNASARGKIKNTDFSPVVGDKVEFIISSDLDKTAVIEEILERDNYIKRPKLANISQLVLVVSSKDPKPDILMLDKQLAFAEFLRINTLIVLNKIDLDKNEQFKEIKKVYTKIGYKVVITDAKSGVGIDELKENLKNKISAFSGNSGVGKSSLTNQIFKREVTRRR